MKRPLMYAMASALILTTSLHNSFSFAQDRVATQSKRPPNIIVIMLDDVSDNIDFMRRTREAARSGTRYVNSFVNFPLCGPSRATFLTGQEAGTHGIRWDEKGGLEPVGLVPQALQEAGYRTAIFGKKPKPVKGKMKALGFDHSAVITDEDGRYFDPVLDVDGKKQRFRGYTSNIAYKLASNFLSAGDKPYFAWIASPSAHAPAIAERRNEGSCIREPFVPSLAFNEADMSDKPDFMQFAPLMDELGESDTRARFFGRCDVLQSDDEWIPKFARLAGPDTCVFLTADNGFMNGEHRVTGKLLLYEESIRVPLIMWGCGAENGGTEKRLVSNVDLPATILELAGATPGRPLDGRSLFSQARSEVRLMGRWGENETSGDGKGFSYGIRQAEWAYFLHKNGGRELYNVKQDPAQEFNLANGKKYEDRRRRLHELLDLR